MQNTTLGTLDLSANSIGDTAAVALIEHHKARKEAGELEQEN